MSLIILINLPLLKIVKIYTGTFFKIFYKSKMRLELKKNGNLERLVSMNDVCLHLAGSGILNFIFMSSCGGGEARGSGTQDRACTR